MYYKKLLNFLQNFFYIKEYNNYITCKYCNNTLSFHNKIYETNDEMLYSCSIYNCPKCNKKTLIYFEDIEKLHYIKCKNCNKEFNIEENWVDATFTSKSLTGKINDVYECPFCKTNQYIKS